MTRLIDADALKESIDEHVYLVHHGFNETEYGCTQYGIHQIIDDAPTVDAVPVKRGKWIHRGCGIFACSKCGKDVGLNVYTGEKASETFKWCPHCGTRMDEPQESEVQYADND